MLLFSLIKEKKSEKTVFIINHTKCFLSCKSAY